MKKIEFSFIAISHSTDLIFESTTSIDDFAYNFMLLFVEQEIDNEFHNVTGQILQQNTPELRNKVDAFVEHYKLLNIKIYKLHSYFQKLTVGEYFIIWTGTVLTIEQRTNFYSYLGSLKDGRDFETVSRQTDELFGELHKIYTIQTFDHTIVNPIGEKEKLKRVCRFCKNMRDTVTFKNRAHAISESLGNKKIILNEECDKCNSEFGSSTGIECSLINFLKFYGIVFGIKGKSGVPKIKGKNFEMSNDGKVNIKYFNINNETPIINKDEIGANVPLDTYDYIVMQDIYKTLSKYLISVVDSIVLSQFQNTISWINGNVSMTKLPEIATLVSYSFFKTHPSLTVYLRQNNDTNFPYAVGEFHYTFLTFVFIIPLTLSDSKDFADQKDFEIFWNFFKHYSLSKDWVKTDFSDKSKRKMNINVHFKQVQR